MSVCVGGGCVVVDVSLCGGGGTATVSVAVVLVSGGGSVRMTRGFGFGGRIVVVGNGNGGYVCVIAGGMVVVSGGIVVVAVAVGIVKFVVVSAFVAVSGVETAGGCVSPGPLIVDETPVADPSSTTSYFCWSFRFTSLPPHAASSIPNMRIGASVDFIWRPHFKGRRIDASRIAHG